MNKGIVIPIVITVFLSCCDKKSTSPINSSNSSTTNNASFYWQENAGTVVKADSAFWKYTFGYTSIKAFKGGIGNSIEINFNGNLNYVDAYTNNFLIYNPTNYTVTSDATLGLRYLKSGLTYSSSSTCTLHIADSKTISTNVNNIITGNINNVALVGGPISAISATFFNLPNRN